MMGDGKEEENYDEIELGGKNADAEGTQVLEKDMWWVKDEEDNQQEVEGTDYFIEKADQDKRKTKQEVKDEEYNQLS